MDQIRRRRRRNGKTDESQRKNGVKFKGKTANNLLLTSVCRICKSERGIHIRGMTSSLSHIIERLQTGHMNKTVHTSMTACTIKTVHTSMIACTNKTVHTSMTACTNKTVHTSMTACTNKPTDRRHQSEQIK